LETEPLAGVAAGTGRVRERAGNRAVEREHPKRREQSSR